MKKIKKQKNQRSKYNSINSNERALIIQYIEEYKYSTSHVSLITGHNTSTIKAIYQVYKKEGRIQKKEKRDKILNITTQVVILVVDDTYIIEYNFRNESCVKLGEEVQNIESTSEENKNGGISKEKMIKELLQNKKCQILSLLTNQQAVNNFTQDVNALVQQKSLSNEFLLIENNLNQKFRQTQQFKYQRNTQQEIFSIITQIPEMQNKSFYSQLLSMLNEQHKLMRM